MVCFPHFVVCVMSLAQNPEAGEADPDVSAPDHIIPAQYRTTSSATLTTTTAYALPTTYYPGSSYLLHYHDRSSHPLHPHCRARGSAYGPRGLRTPSTRLRKAGSYYPLWRLRDESQTNSTRTQAPGQCPRRDSRSHPGLAPAPPRRCATVQTRGACSG